MTLHNKTDLAMLLKGIRDIQQLLDTQRYTITPEPVFQGQGIRDKIDYMEKCADRLVQEFAQAEYQMESDPHRYD